MFEKGNLLLFRPFVFKNGAMPKDKFFLVLENVDGNLLLASLPTSKDHVPSDVEVKHGCLDLAERFVNVFVFGCGITLHSRTHNLNIAPAAAQDVAQRPFQIVNTNRVAGWRLDFNNAEVIIFWNSAIDNQGLLL